MRLALFVDAAFRSGPGPDRRVFSGDELFGFIRFASAVGHRLGGIRVIARSTMDQRSTRHQLPADVELSPLPDYGNLRNLGRLVLSIPGTVRALWRSLDGVDLVWVSASNPIGLILIGLAKIRSVKIAILVRQDSMAYFRRRLPSGRWKPILVPLWAVDRIYRLIARSAPTTVVGEEIERSYGGPRQGLLRFVVGTTDEAQVIDHAKPRDLSGEIHLLTVGRVEAEKNPLLLIDALAILERESPGRYMLTWAGEGAMRQQVLDHAAGLGIADRVRLPGFVPLGPRLFELYDGSHVLVHVALTEGVPQVLGEAMARGLPLVATDVGGIRGELDDGRRGRLVPPEDAIALANAIRELSVDGELRERLAEAALERAAEISSERQSAAVAEFLLS